MAACCASPSRHISSLLLPFLHVEAVDPGSAFGVELVRALVSSLLELDDLVLPAFRFAVLSEHYGLVEERVVERQPLGWRNSHILGDKLDISLSLLSVCDVLWLMPSLLGATSARVLR